MLKIRTICFIAFVSLYVLTNNNEILAKPTNTKTEKIKLYHEYLQNLHLNTEIDPCKNFIGYVCGEKKSSYYLETFDINGTKEEYESCLNSSLVHEKYSFIIDDLWKPGKEEWNGCQKLRCDEASIKVINVEIIENVILLSYGFHVKSTLNEAINSDKEKNEILKAMINNGIDQKHAEKLLDEMIEASKKIVNAMTNCSRNENWYTQVKFTDLQAKFPDIDWMDIIKTVDNETLITIADQTCTFAYLEEIMKDVRGSFNFLNWRTTKTYQSLVCYEWIHYFNTPLILDNYIMKLVYSDVLQNYVSILNRLAESIRKRAKNNDILISDVQVDSFIRSQKKYIYTVISLLKQANITISVTLDDFQNGEILDEKSLEQFEPTLKFLLSQKEKLPYALFSQQFPEVVKLLFIDVLNNSDYKAILRDQLNKCLDDIKFNVSNILLPLYNPYEIFLWTTALKISFDEFQKYITEKSDGMNIEDKISEMNLTPGQIFFIENVHQHCSKDLKYQMFILTSLLNMEDFSKEFNCPIGSAMNPSEESCYKI